MGAAESMMLAERAARLEHFELSLATQAQAEAEAEADALREQLRLQTRAHVDEVSDLKRAALDPVDTVVAMLREYPALQADVTRWKESHAELAAALDQAEADKTTLAEQIDQLISSTTVAAKGRDTAAKQLAQVRDALEVTKSALKARDTELKELRALNPKRLQKQVKTLQARNAELQQVSSRNQAALKTTTADLKAARLAAGRAQRDNATLLEKFDALVEQVNAGELDDQLWQSPDKKWALIGHTDAARRILVQYVPTGELRLFDIDQELVRAQAVPAYVKDEARARLERYAKIDAHLGTYADTGKS